MPADLFGDLVSTTIERRTKKSHDNITVHSPMLSKLSKSKAMKTFTGGEYIRVEVERAFNPSVQRYKGADVLSIAQTDIYALALYDLALMSDSVMITGEDKLKNAGDEQMINLVTGRVDNAIKSLKNQVCADLFSDGTASSGKQIKGLLAA